MEGLEEKPCTGRPAYITEGQRKQLNEFIKKKSNHLLADALSGAIYMTTSLNCDKHYHPNSIYYLLAHMGFSWITSCSKHPKPSQKIQDDLKKFQIETILKIPSRVDVWFQDEARFGQQNKQHVFGQLVGRDLAW
ncbi:hypothetical protein QWY96_04690 [Vibrio artabrorum]|uniref:Winged helix-turn helix domain-containing protein n=1 Tax=Vibrio artabrorum TaxID=446374 RepID=A0ABT8CIJ0_9VIBR|nr:hypothetical protein [Vibrio artabrorum]MDN3700379.1 hypothetical protein [Vibrio artabrorum]